jgi:hypothetical protein
MIRHMGWLFIFWHSAQRFVLPVSFPEQRYRKITVESVTLVKSVKITFKIFSVCQIKFKGYHEKWFYNFWTKIVEITHGVTRVLQTNSKLSAVHWVKGEKLC